MPEKIAIIVPSTWERNLNIISTSSPGLWNLLQQSGAQLIPQNLPLFGCADKLTYDNFGAEKVIVVLGSPLPFQLSMETLSAICQHRNWLAVLNDQPLQYGGTFLPKAYLPGSFQEVMQ